MRPSAPACGVRQPYVGVEFFRTAAKEFPIRRAGMADVFQFQLLKRETLDSKCACSGWRFTGCHCRRAHPVCHSWRHAKQRRCHFSRLGQGQNHPVIRRSPRRLSLDHGKFRCLQSFHGLRLNATPSERPQEGRMSRIGICLALHEGVICNDGSHSESRVHVG